jgi:hypothetical protein
LKNKIKIPIGVSSLLPKKSLVKVSGEDFRVREMVVKNLMKTDGAFIQLKGSEGQVTLGLTIEDTVSLRTALEVIIKEGW